MTIYHLAQDNPGWSQPNQSFGHKVSWARYCPYEGCWWCPCGHRSWLYHRRSSLALYVTEAVRQADWRPPHGKLKDS